MKVVAVGGKAFVTGFVLSGVSGEYVSNPESALKKIESLSKDPTVGLIMVSDDVAKPISDRLTAMKTKKAIPLIYEVPGPGSKKEKVEYRAMLRAILGV
ncbi:MAG: vacuolar H+transporting two-sector ATPase F subunit [Nitrososphaerota archaeon]|nr:vacuolar H+transporting two-sector ATPase F subunit [Nitrososphaerota archaeon]MDG6990592.1 vacuolar H+transporting two-sector ATPase F subunit [Nitrososphaerota archaeon]